MHAVLVFADYPFVRDKRVHGGGDSHTRTEHHIVADLDRRDVQQLTVEIHVEIFAEFYVKSVLHSDIRLEERTLCAVRENLFDKKSS